MTSAGSPLPQLSADCSQCFGLCCVLLPFRRADGFGVDKPGGLACDHLQGNDLCGIHDKLDDSGWSGCAAYDCQGAGQQVSQVTYAGVSWRERGNLGEMAAVLSVMRVLHAMIAGLTGPGESALRDQIIALTSGTPDELLLLDLDELDELVVGRG